MKGRLAWIVTPLSYGDDDDLPERTEIRLEEPYRGQYDKVVPIVYFELEKEN